MKKKNEIRMIFCSGAMILLLATAFQLVTSMTSGQDDFILPPRGGGMVHCDPQLTDNIRLPVPTTNVGMVWYRDDLGGEKCGTWGPGIAGNGKIAASTFNNYHVLQHNNLIIYDYYGNHIWSDNQLLNPGACYSTPMVDIHDWVVAYDNYKIIFVNVSNRDNVHIEWTSNIASGGLPYSPTIERCSNVFYDIK